MFFAVALMAAVAAAADAPWIVWDASLQPVTGRLARIDADRVRLVDQNGLDVTIDNPLAMVRLEPQRAETLDDAAWSASNEWESFVTLTDGQRWEAEIIEQGESENLELRVRRLGRVSLPLDVVRSIAMTSDQAEIRPAHAAASGVDDAVELANGDVLRGTVIAIGREVQIEGDSGIVRVNRRAVRWIGLVNPESPPPPLRLWYSSGSVFGARSISQNGALSFDAIGPAAGRLIAAEFGRIDGSDGASDLVGIEFVPRRLIAISSLPVTTVETEGARRWTGRPQTQPGRMGQGVLIFPGPMSARLELPARGSRIAAEFTLGDTPGEWADCVVRVEQSGVALWEGRLNRNQPVGAFVAPLAPGREITVRILPGAYGPVQDRVELRLGWVLLATTPDE